MNKCAFKAQKLRARNKRGNKTERRRAREEKEEMCSLSQEFNSRDSRRSEVAKSSVAASGTHRFNAAITWPYTFDS